MSKTSRLARSQYLRLMKAYPRLAALAYLPKARMARLQLNIRKDGVDVSRGAKTVRVAHSHQFYIPDVIENFDCFHSSVEPKQVDGLALVDFSKPSFHRVRGYDLHDVKFPAFSEPVATSRQYLEFAELSDGAVVLDLGAYSGLTSALFDQAVGRSGRVIAVDADAKNVDCIRSNLALYESATGRKIDLLEAAVWHEDGELSFSSEGNMGSSAAMFVGAGRAATVSVPSLTLSSLAKRYALEHVDFIKCDIEGAEAVIFDQPEFFAHFRPRLMIEVHYVNGTLTAEACVAALERYGYTCRLVPQVGSELPLLECVPSRATQSNRANPPRNITLKAAA